MRLAKADVPDQDDVGLACDEGQTEQVLDLLAVDLFGPTPLEIIEGFEHGKARVPDAALPQNERQENRTEGNKATNGATEERRLDQNRATEERGRDGERNRTTTGQGAAPNKGNVSVNITPEKRTQMHQVFTKERSAPRVDRVDFDLAVGTAVPRSVHFVSVPSTIVAIEPSWRGYDYFMVGEQIVIVDPRSMEIVAIIDA